MANTSTFGGRFALFLLALFLAGTVAAQNCGGKERWDPKDGTDPQALNVDVTISPDVDIVIAPRMDDASLTRTKQLAMMALQCV